MSEKIIFITQYFKIENNDSRQLELDTCLKINSNNPFIDKIILLNEKIYDDAIFRNKKIKQIDISKRLTYNDVFEYCDKNCNKNNIKILANTDIILSYTDIQYLKSYNLNNKLLALLRYELVLPTKILNENFNYNNIKNDWIHDNKNCKTSQDVWIFNYIKPNKIYNFELGIRGCDNRISYLLDKNKYNVTNPSLSIESYHLHSNAQKSHENRKRRNYQPFSKWEYKCLDPIKDLEIENLKIKNLK